MVKLVHLLLLFGVYNSLGIEGLRLHVLLLKLICLMKRYLPIVVIVEWLLLLLVVA